MHTIKAVLWEDFGLQTHFCGHFLWQHGEDSAACFMERCSAAPLAECDPFSVKMDCHRITEEFGLEGTCKGHLVQPPCNEQGHLQLDQVAQSPVQPGVECFQGWGIYHCYLYVYL